MRDNNTPFVLSSYASPTVRAPMRKYNYSPHKVHKEESDSETASAVSENDFDELSKQLNGITSEEEEEEEEEEEMRKGLPSIKLAQVSPKKSPSSPLKRPFSNNYGTPKYYYDNIKEGVRKAEQEPSLHVLTQYKLLSQEREILLQELNKLREQEGDLLKRLTENHQQSNNLFHD
jgi:hypothetical protein